MWPDQYPHRLQDWNLLRDQCQHMPKDLAMVEINDWWFGAPIIPRLIIWEDHEHWPDPWNLLQQNKVCDLARALGIMYTVIMTWPQDSHSCELVQTDHDNLVLVEQGKYILNWATGQVLNILSHKITVRRTLDSSRFNHLVR